MARIKNSRETGFRRPQILDLIAGRQTLSTSTLTFFAIRCIFVIENLDLAVAVDKGYYDLRVRS